MHQKNKHQEQISTINSIDINDLKHLIFSAGWDNKVDRYLDVFKSARTKSDSKEIFEISIIIISWKNNNHLKTALQSARNQKNIKAQLIFVNNGAGNNLDWCEDYANTYIELKINTGAYLARNIGALFSQSDILLFLEDDGISDSMLACNHFKTHRLMPDILSTRGVYLPITSSDLNNQQNHYYLGQKALCCHPNLEGNAAFKKEVFMGIGGWDDKIVFGHGGLDIAKRLSNSNNNYRKMIYIPHAVLFHDYAKGKEHLAIKLEKQKKGMAYLLKKFPSIYNTYLSILKDDKEINLPKEIKEDISKARKRFSKYIKEYAHNRRNVFGQKEISKVSLIKSLSKSYKIYALGAGSLGQRFAELCETKKIKINCFIDKESNEITIRDIPVIDTLPDLDRGIIIITTSFVESALNDIEKSKNKKPKKIYIFR